MEYFMFGWNFRKSIHGILIYISCIGTLVRPQSSSLDLTIKPAGNVREGGTLVLTCKVHGKKPMDLIRVVRLIGEKEYEVATNDYLKEKYRNTGRYWITAWDENQGRLELTVSDVKGEDAGNFGCKHMPDSSSSKPITKYTDVIVDVKPHSVDLLYEARDGRWYKAGEGERIQFKSAVRCNVKMDGTDFEPKVEISVGGGSNLQSTKSNHKELKDDDGFSRITHSVQHTVTLDGRDLNLHGKTLTCTATVPQFSPTSGSIILEIPHRPQITCPRDWIAVPCSENFTVTCRALMFPQLSSHVWSWGEKDQHRIVDGVPNKDHISRFTSQYFINENDEYVFKLIIDEIKNKDFSSYTLNVTNSQGSDQVTISIIKEPRVTQSVQSTTLQPLKLVINEDPSPYRLASGAETTVYKIVNMYSLLSLCLTVFSIYISDYSV